MMKSISAHGLGQPSCSQASRKEYQVKGPHPQCPFEGTPPTAPPPKPSSAGPANVSQALPRNPPKPSSVSFSGTFGSFVFRNLRSSKPSFSETVETFVFRNGRYLRFPNPSFFCGNLRFLGVWHLVAIRTDQNH